jgi:hypothetical protein
VTLGIHDKCFPDGNHAREDARTPAPGKRLIASWRKFLLIISLPIAPLYH